MGDTQAQLQTLALRWCPNVRSLGQVGSLGELRTLRVQGLNIHDITPLAGLTNLRVLTLADCERVEDLSPLSGLPLRTLNLQRTGRRVDLAPLGGMRNLSVVHSGNVYNADRLGPGSRAYVGLSTRLED